MGKLLLNGVTRSCGCYRQELMTKHGLSRTKIYRTWSDMRSRCHNPNDTGFKNYGERGIAVCDEWRNDFVAFYEYVSKLEHFGEEGYSLDRINVNGNYEPGNVKFSTTKEQARNKTTTRYIEVDGKQIVLADAAEQNGITAQLIRDRIDRGETGKEILRPPKPTKRYIDIGGGKKVTVTEAARIAGIGRATIHRRLANGEMGSELLRPVQFENHYIEINGVQMTITEVTKAAGVTRKTIYDRLAKGESGEMLLRPARAKK